MVFENRSYGASGEDDVLDQTLNKLILIWSSRANLETEKNDENSSDLIEAWSGPFNVWWDECGEMRTRSDVYERGVWSDSSDLYGGGEGVSVDESISADWWYAGPFNVEVEMTVADATPFAEKLVAMTSAETKSIAMKLSDEMIFAEARSFRAMYEKGEVSVNEGVSAKWSYADRSFAGPFGAAMTSAETKSFSMELI